MTILNINNKKYELDLKGNETLLEVLRNHLGLTGTKSGCTDAECGCCTVEVDGKAILSCIALASNYEGRSITTIEGVADGEDLHPLQEAFIDKGAVQCGFCTPGMIISSKALIEKNPTPTREDIDYALDGNLCRCAGYLKIVEAIEQAAEDLRKK